MYDPMTLQAASYSAFKVNANEKVMLINLI